MLRVQEISIEINEIKEIYLSIHSLSSNTINRLLVVLPLLLRGSSVRGAGDVCRPKSSALTGLLVGSALSGVLAGEVQVAPGRPDDEDCTAVPCGIQ